MKIKTPGKHNNSLKALLSKFLYLRGNKTTVQTSKQTGCLVLLKKPICQIKIASDI